MEGAPSPSASDGGGGGGGGGAAGLGRSLGGRTAGSGVGFALGELDGEADRLGASGFGGDGGFDDGGFGGGGGGGSSALAAAAAAAAAVAEAEADRRPIALPSTAEGPGGSAAGVDAASQATILLKKRREARLLDEAVAQARARFVRRSAALDARAAACDRRRAELEQMLVTLKPVIEVRAGAARGAGRRRWRARPRASKQPAR